MSTLCDAGKCGNIVRAFEAHLGADLTVEFNAFRVVTVKQIEEGCLCSGRALASQELQRSDRVLDCLKIKYEILKPECCPLAYRYKLRGLEMSKSQCRHGLIFFSESSELTDEDYKSLPDENQCFTHDDDISVVADIA